MYCIEFRYVESWGESYLTRVLCALSRTHHVVGYSGRSVFELSALWQAEDRHVDLLRHGRQAPALRCAPPAHHRARAPGVVRFCKELGYNNDNGYDIGFTDKLRSSITMGVWKGARCNMCYNKPLTTTYKTAFISFLHLKVSRALKCNTKGESKTYKHIKRYDIWFRIFILKNKGFCVFLTLFHHLTR